MRTRLFAAVAAGAALATMTAVTVTGAASGAAEGATITDVGWWSRNPAASAPADGINVSNAADGPVSVAAVEIVSSTSLQNAVLMLPEEGGIQADSAKLQVCTTPNDWKAGANQAWGEAPRPECESAGRAELKRNPSSSTWAADVTALLGEIEDEGSVSLMVVPAGDATVPVAFEVRFEKPQFSSEAVATSSGSSASSYSPSEFSSSTETSSDESFANASASSDSFGNSGSESTEFAPSTFETASPIAPAAPTTADGAAGAPTPDAAAPEASAADSAASTELAAVPTQATTGAAGGGNAGKQAVFFVLIATLAGVGAGGGRYVIRRRAVDPDPFAA